MSIRESVEDPINQAKGFLHAVSYAHITSIAGRISEIKLQKAEEMYDRVFKTNLGFLYKTQDKLVEAERMYERA